MTPDPNLIVVDFCNRLCEIRTRLALTMVKAFNWSAGRNLMPPSLMRDGRSGSDAQRSHDPAHVLAPEM